MQITAQLRMVRALGVPDGERMLELPDADPVESVLEVLGLIHQQEHLLLLIDGRAVEPGQRLQDGDLLVILPRLSGG